MPSGADTLISTPAAKIGLALGSGSARGWSHIGVIRALEEAGIVPDLVCGTSIGALVGAAYAAGELDRLEPWVKSLTWQNVVGLLDMTISGGLIKGNKLVAFFRSHYTDTAIEQLPKAFGAVCTDLATGQEVWLREGMLIDSVRASIAVPGLFAPVARGDLLLVDGALVNPVPVSLCRAMGADIVIAVELSSGMKIPRLRKPVSENKPAGQVSALLSRLQAGIGMLRSGPTLGTALPSVIDVMASSINIMQVQITRSRFAAEPADVVISPQLAQMAQMDFHRATEAIDEGRRATGPMLAQIQALLAGSR